ncbi:MAG: topoisomerase C-terminal repeat-containing protein, partial [Actinomycetota bacterium]
PDTGLPIYMKNGRYGPYIQMGEMDDSKDKPPTASLFKDMDPATVTLDEALRLLSLPRVVGTDDDGEEITALNGRYGPYIKKGKETRSLDTEAQIFSITVDEAKALLAQPKKGRRGSATVLKELGEDPQTGAAMTIKDGRYGPYVTDGTTNASIPRGDSPEEVTSERGSELLAERRAKGPAKRRKKTTKKKTSKKTTRKKTTAKKTSTRKKT